MFEREVVPGLIALRQKIRLNRPQLFGRRLGGVRDLGGDRESENLDGASSRA